MNVRFASMTDCGCRDYNEDSIGCFKNGDNLCLVLADGLGGHGKGEIASGTAVEMVKDVFMASDNPDIAEMFEKAQERVMQLQAESHDFDSMKTTLVVALKKGNTLQWGHIGDSRVYLFRKNKYISHTLDHSVPQMLVFSGEIRESEIRRHIDRNKLLRVIGTKWETPRYQLADPINLCGDESILLCSDGFWENIEEKPMAKLLKKAASPEEWLENMKAVVLKNGDGTNMDNYSAVCAFIGN